VPFLRVALPLATFLLVAAVAPAAEPPPRARASLLARQPLGFDLETVAKLRDAWALVPELPARIGEQGRMLGVASSALMLLLLVAIGYGAFGQRRFAARVDARLAPIKERCPAAARTWFSGGAQVLAAGLLPIALWGLHAAVADVTDYDHPAFVLTGSLLLAWAQFSIATTVARELLVRPLLPISPEHGRHLFGIARWLLFYAILLAAALHTVGGFGAPSDVVALLRAVFRLTLILFFVIAFARKSSVLALFPDVPNRFYRGSIALLGHIYPLAVAVTAATALLALAGYRNLATFVWVRTWALAGLVVGASLFVHLLHRLLRWWILPEEPGPETARDFYRSAGRLLDYLGIIIVLVLALDLIGVRQRLAHGLSIPVYTAGNREISILLLLIAAAIFLAFFLLARSLRDYLDYRVYPALSLEEGVAHAISTFVFYLMVVVGVLVAMQAIGLGIGSITVFAGALGIGLGFGLQSLAGNLASGLTLIFSRALRRGDWVTVGDTVGVIQEVGIRATRLRTRDAVEYLVPNAEFVSGTIVNWTRTSPDVRLHVPLGVSYGSDPERIREILLGIVRECDFVRRTPPPDVWFIGFGDSSLDFELLVWANLKQISEKQVRSELYFRIFRAFRQAGVEIPFPQRDVHIKEVVTLRRQDEKS
jgi:small-conductance mechanosensitive channel